MSLLIETELAAAEKALAENEQEMIELQEEEVVVNKPVHIRLSRLEQQSDDLVFAHKVAIWAKEFHYDDNSLTQDVDALKQLALVLCPNDEDRPLVTGYHAIAYQREFLPLYEYLQSNLILALRRQLKQAGYPLHCEVLLQQWEQGIAESEVDEIQKSCESLDSIATSCKQISKLGMNPSSQANTDSLTLELCRPIVERVRFHFVESAEDRPTSTRIDRLPEWLLDYIRKNVFNNGVWDLVQDVIAPNISPGLEHSFLNEMIRLIQWVLAERNFFRDPLIAGPDSKPILMSNAIEQLLKADSYFSSLVEESGRIVSLVDVCIAGDDELLQWWLDRERESAFSTLFEEELPSTAFNCISPRAELFCAILRSVQLKASVFRFSGPYLAHVASPLCLQFLEAVQESANDLKTPLQKARKIPSTSLLQANLERWMELINGTNMAARLLSDSSTDDNLSSFGRSLWTMQDGLIQDFGASYLELMERAKLASYLLRCSFMVASNHDNHEHDFVSGELQESRALLSLLVQTTNNYKETFAASRMRDCVVSLLAEKFLEVALNTDGMTPDLVEEGCSIFLRDTESLFMDQTELPHVALRLLDVTRLMSLGAAELANIGNALCGLAGEEAPLDHDAFADERLAEEAISMMHAKGFVWIGLTDTLAVLNRRRDLGSNSKEPTASSPSEL